MRALILPSWPHEGGLPREAPLQELLPHPGDAPSLPEAALSAQRISFGEFLLNACNGPNTRTATALVLSLVRGHTSYTAFEKTCAEFRESIESLPVQCLAYSTHRHGGAGVIQQKRHSVLAEVHLVLPLERPVDFGKCSHVEFIETARAMAEPLGLVGALVSLPRFPLRTPCGSVAGAMYLAKSSGPCLDVAGEILQRQLASMRSKLGAKLSQLEEGGKLLAAEIESTRAQMAALEVKS